MYSSSSFSFSTFEWCFSSLLLSFFRLRLLSRSFFFLVELISILFEIELFSTFACRVKFFFAENVFFDDDDNNVFDFWLNIWLNFVKKRENRNENDDDYEKHWLSQNKAIDANIPKSINRVIDVSKRIRFVRHNFVNLSVMFSILLKFRIKTQMKVQDEKIIVDQHIDDHFSNVPHYRFESSNVVRDVLCWSKWWFKTWSTNRSTFLTRTSWTSFSEFFTNFLH